MSRLARCLLLCCGLSNALLGCGWEELDKPAAPDTQPVTNELEAPTGKLAGMSPTEVAAFLQDASEGLELACGYNPARDDCTEGDTCRQCGLVSMLGDALTKLVASLGDAGTPGEEAEAPERIDGLSGVLFVDSVCHGWGDKAAAKAEPDPANGAFHATVGFTHRGLDPVVWGNLEDCKRRVAGRKLRLDGTYFLAFQVSAVPLAELQSVPLVFHYEGDIYARELDRSVRVQIALEQRLDGRGKLQVVLFTKRRGSFVWTIDRAGVSVRGADREFVCDVEARQCSVQ